VGETDAGVCLVDWGDHGAAVDRLEATFGAPARRARPGRVASEIQEFFAGTRRSFDVRVDLGCASRFGRVVLERLAQVPFGVLTTYGALAAAVGSSARAVGQAVGANPVPIIVPCHRVVAADGTLGGFGGGLGRKRILLDLEGHEPLEGGWAPRRRRASS
jgi:methylated-DNA-[protein]-cysteine S-methyltransferase